MALFRYEAADATGKVLRGAMDATSVHDVRARLAKKGLRDVEIHAARDEAKRPGGVPSAPAAALATFFRQMASLTHAGFTVGDALANLAPRTADRRLNAAIGRWAAQTRGGASFADCLAGAGGLVPAHMVGLVHAGETGGFLPEMCDEAALGAEMDVALRRDLWWPQLLIWQGIWSILLFAPLFPSISMESIGQSAVRYVRALLTLSLPLGLGLHALAWWQRRFARTPAGALWRDRFLAPWPVSRRLARVRALAAFTRTLEKLLSAGIAPVVAYDAAVQAVPNVLYRERLAAGLPVVRSAGGIDAAIQAAGLMDHDPLQQLITGQQTGRWSETLGQVAAFYQDESALATDAARTAYKRSGFLVALLTSGYVAIAATYGMLQLGLHFADNAGN